MHLGFQECPVESRISPNVLTPSYRNWRITPRLNAPCSSSSVLYPLPFTFFEVIALVVLFLPLARPISILTQAFSNTAPMGSGCNLAFDQTDQPFDLALLQQQLRVRVGSQTTWVEASSGGKVGTKQVDLTIADDDIAVTDVGLAGAQDLTSQPCSSRPASYLSSMKYSMTSLLFSAMVEDPAFLLCFCSWG